MNVMLSTETFDQLVDDLAAAKKWFSSLHRMGPENRFDEIVVHVKNAQRYAKSPVNENHNLDIPKTYVSLIDAISFIEIHKNFQRLSDQQLPRGRLKEIVKGPLMPHDERLDGRSTSSRDAMFELNLAAALMSKNITVLRFDDIWFKMENIIANVQCKRPQSAKSFKSAFIKGCEQLSKRLLDGDRGLIAICLDCVLGTNKSLFHETSQNMASWVINTLNTFCVSNQSLFRRVLDTRIIGVILELPYIVRLKDRKDLLTSGRQRSLFPICEEKTLQLVDSAIIRRLAETLQ